MSVGGAAVAVRCVEDPIDKVAVGAVALAQDMPEDMFTSIE